MKLFQDEYRLPLLDPAVAARLAAFTEITFPLFLFAGLATRLATLPLLGMTFIIQFVVYPDALGGTSVVGDAARLPAGLRSRRLLHRPRDRGLLHAKAAAYSDRTWPWLVVGGSLCLVLGIAVITFPALIPASGATVTVIQWLLMLAALVLFVATAAAGGTAKTARVAATG